MEGGRRWEASSVRSLESWTRGAEVAGYPGLGDWVVICGASCAQSRGPLGSTEMEP